MSQSLSATPLGDTPQSKDRFITAAHDEEWDFLQLWTEADGAAMSLG
jgi:hypothetical protein